MSFRPPSRQLATALCCLLALGTVASVGAADSHVAIEQAPGSETLGDVAELTVSTPENGSATVTVAAAGTHQYNRTVRLIDSSGDGAVTLYINTFRGKEGANDSAVYSVSDGDEVAVVQSTGSRLTAGDYGVAVYNGTETDGEPRSTTTLRLAEPTTGSVSYSIVHPNVTDRLDAREGIEEARRDGSLVDIEETEEVAAGDSVLLTLNVDGLEGALRAAPGANDTARFMSVLDRANTSLRLEWYRGVHLSPVQRHLNRSAVTAVVADSSNNTYHVVVNTADADLMPATNDRVEDGDELTPYFTVADEQRLDSDGYGGSEFAVGEPDSTLLTDARSAHDDATVTVRGETNLAPGSEVVVRFAANNTTVGSASQTVDSERRFEVRLSVETARQADSTTLTVRHNGTVIEEIWDPNVLSVPSDQSIADGALRVPAVWLPNWGYLHVIGSDGAVVGRSGELTQHQYHNVTIPLSITELGPEESLVVVPAREDSIDPASVSYDNAFLIDGPPAGLSVNVTTVNETEASTAPPTTPERNGTSSITPERNGTSSTPPVTSTPRDTPFTGTPTDAATTGADGPGFGAPAALLAVTLAALGKRYRQVSHR